MEKIEKLLKVLLVPNEMFLDTYIQLIPTHSCLDLLKLMEIKVYNIHFIITYFNKQLMMFTGNNQKRFRSLLGTIWHQMLSI